MEPVVVDFLSGKNVFCGSTCVVFFAECLRWFETGVCNCVA